MAAVNSVATTRLPLPSFSPRAVLMYSAAVGGEGAVALQLREATPAELADERLAIACNEPELLADLLHAAADMGGDQSLTALLSESSPNVTFTSDTSDGLRFTDNRDSECSIQASKMFSSITTVSLAMAGMQSRPPIIAKKVRPKPLSPNIQGPQQCQVCNKIFGNASALAKHKLTHSDERKYVCTVCSKAFKRQDHLNGHMLTHRNKKPYECKADGCGKSYCDARSLRRHTENHHHHNKNNNKNNNSDDAKSSAAYRDAQKPSSSGSLPSSPTRNTPPHSDSSNHGSERSSSGNSSGSRGCASSSSGGCGSSTSGSSSSGSESSPPSTPPAPATPPAKPRPRPTKTKSLPLFLQVGNQKSGSGCGSSSSGVTSGAICDAIYPPRQPPEQKPVECNLCHRKFKNIPALNGHMRLHGGYFKKDSESKKLDKKETSGPPLQTASVSVRALIEEKIISRRTATVTNTSTAGTLDSTSRTSFATPALSALSRSSTSPSSPATTASSKAHFASPRAPPVLTVTSNVTAAQRDSTLIELLKKGNSKVVKRCASDPGHVSPAQEFTFRPELFGVSFHSDDGYFSPALNEDAFHFNTTPEELASLEDYATVAASISDRSPGTFPSSRKLAAVLNSPLPESLADFGACHGGSPVTSPGIGFTANSPVLSYSTGESPGLAYTATSPCGTYTGHPTPSPGIAYPTPPGSHDAQSPAHSVPRASSPLSAAFFTATMSSQEEVEEALEEVLPEECGSLDAFTLEPANGPRRIMLNSEDPLLSSSPRDFNHQRQLRRQHRLSSTSNPPIHPWQTSTESQDNLQVCVEGRDGVPAVFLSPSSVPASPQRRKRRASPLGPCRTRMRRTTAHYTPQPILPPERDGPGLFCELTAGLPTTNVHERPPPAEDVPPQINIGIDHQAEIPELYNDRLDLHRPTEQQLWDPGINDRLDDNEVRMFMELAMCAAMPVGGHTREYALQVLGECDGDIRTATLRLMSRSPSPTPHEHRWTPDEVEAFLAGLRHYDKDFYKIAQLIRTKDSKQCVQFYYFWKKITKDYKTIFMTSWNFEMQVAMQGTSSKPPTPHSHAPCTSSASTFEEEYPCKICGKVFNKVKSRSAHMKSHRPSDAEPKRPKIEKPFEKVERHDDRTHPDSHHSNNLGKFKPV